MQLAAGNLAVAGFVHATGPLVARLGRGRLAFSVVYALALLVLAAAVFSFANLSAIHDSDYVSGALRAMAWLLFLGWPVDLVAALIHSRLTADALGTHSVDYTRTPHG